LFQTNSNHSGTQRIEEEIYLDALSDTTSHSMQSPSTCMLQADTWTSARGESAVLRKVARKSRRSARPREWSMRAIAGPGQPAHRGSFAQIYGRPTSSISAERKPLSAAVASRYSTSFGAIPAEEFSLT